MKKKILLSLAIIVSFVFSLKAQVDNGDWLLGGTLGINTSNAGSSTNYSNSNITPHMGYAIGNKTVLGLNLGVNFSESSSQNKNFTLFTGAFCKKYFQIKEKFGAYLQFNAGVGWIRSSFSSFDSSGASVKINSSTHTYVAGIAPGLYYQVSRSVLLNVDCGNLVYNYYDQGNKNWVSNFGFNLLNSFTFGVDFILGKKRAN